MTPVSVSEGVLMRASFLEGVPALCGAFPTWATSPQWAPRPVEEPWQTALVDRLAPVATSAQASVS
eukprot:498228-Pyramimonas_sp.AAC.1